MNNTCITGLPLHQNGFKNVFSADSMDRSYTTGRSYSFTPTPISSTGDAGRNDSITPTLTPSPGGSWLSIFETVVIILIVILIIAVSFRDLCKNNSIGTCLTGALCSSRSSDTDIESNYSSEVTGHGSEGAIADDPPCYDNALGMPKPAHKHASTTADVAEEAANSHDQSDIHSASNRNVDSGYTNDAYEMSPREDSETLPGYEEAMEILSMQNMQNLDEINVELSDDSTSLSTSIIYNENEHVSENIHEERVSSSPITRQTAILD